MTRRAAIATLVGCARPAKLPTVVAVGTATSISNRGARPSLAADHVDQTRPGHRLIRRIVRPHTVPFLALLSKDRKMPKVTRKSVAKSKAPAKSKPNSGTQAKQASRAKAAAERNAPVFFHDVEDSGEWGFLSPWSRCEFEVKDVVYQSAGQYIMAEKARAFGDKVSHQWLPCRDDGSKTGRKCCKKSWKKRHPTSCDPLAKQLEV